MTTREKFVERFGEHDAVMIEDAATQHRKSDDGNFAGTLCVMLAGEQVKFADDQFILDIATCISWECLTRFLREHCIDADKNDLRDWIRQNAVPPASYRDPATPVFYREYLGE